MAPEFWKEVPMSDSVHFGTLHPDGTVTDERDIKRSSIDACPFLIMVPEHYRPDESCRCDDPDHTEMASWGYVWNGSLWTASDDEDE